MSTDFSFSFLIILLSVSCEFKWIECWEFIIVDISLRTFFSFFFWVSASILLIIDSIVLSTTNMSSCLQLAESKLESDRVLRLIPEWSKSVRYWKLKLCNSFYF